MKYKTETRVKARTGRRAPERIGLALGSGGARGWAHIGVIQALREAGIPVHCVAGTSMGAFIGAAFASRKIHALHEVALQLDWKRALHYFLEIGMPRSGLIDGKRVDEFLREYVGSILMENLPTPLAVVATDIRTGAEVVIRKGELIPAVRASIALPGIFTPVLIDGMMLSDGGLVNPVPVDAVRAMDADYVIAVDVNHGFQPRNAADHADGFGMKTDEPAAMDDAGGKEKLHALVEKLHRRLQEADMPALRKVSDWMSKMRDPDMFTVMANAVRIMECRLAEVMLQMHPPDLLIRPEVGRLFTLEFHRASEAIRAGHEAARQALASANLKRG